MADIFIPGITRETTGILGLLKNSLGITASVVAGGVIIPEREAARAFAPKTMVSAIGKFQITSAEGDKETANTLFVGLGFGTLA